MELTMARDNQSDRVDIQSTITEFRTPVCEIVRAERAQRGVKAAIAHASDVTGLPYRRVRACWYNEVRAVLAHELEQVRRNYRRWVWDRRMRVASDLQRLDDIIRELERDG